MRSAELTSSVARPRPRALISVTVRPRRGRGWGLLSLLTLLGLLSMHGTPMTRMTESGAGHSTAHASTRFAATASMSSHRLAMHAMSVWPTSPRTQAALSAGGAGQQFPAQHMTAPCLSDGLRSAHSASPSATWPSERCSSPVAVVARSVSAGGLLSRAPPDLLKLCISRT